MAETILPATDTPGAKEAKVGEFMTVIVKDCYEEKDQKTFLEGMKKATKRAPKRMVNHSWKARRSSATTCWLILTKKQDYGKTKKPEDPNHYFSLIKQLTLWGYFTSEPGATKALRYVAVPGRYEGCIPYKKGDKAWAT